MTPLFVKRSELAHALDLSEVRVTQLVNSGVLPRPKAKGSYDLVASVRTYLRYLRTSNQSTLAIERTRFVKARADREELNLKARAGELVEVATVKQIMFERGRQVRDAVLSTPDRLSGILAAEHDQTKIHSQLTRELHQALEALTS